jgi:nitrogen regulatory protein P-II 1
MKLVVAFIQPFKLDEVRRQLQRLSGFTGLSVTRASGFGLEKREVTSHGASDELADFSENVRIETVVQDTQAEVVLTTIATAAHTGRYGDGLVFIVPVEGALRIKTLQRGDDAV